MDPYIEAPGIWPDFHEAFAFCIREALQPALPAGYYAALRTREEIGVGLEGDAVVRYSEVSVKGTDATREGRERAPADTSVLTACEHLVLTGDPLRMSFVEIREVAPGGRLVTLIEVLSPSNKRPGPDRESFARKQQEIFGSDANWVEIDLLRAGQRHGGDPRVDAHCQAKGYDYVVVVSRAQRRRPAFTLDLYGFTVRDPFPVVGIPLRAPDPDVPLSLDQVFVRAYDTGPYRKIIDYDAPLDPRDR